MAFCPECGKSTAPDATKCVHCGTELAKAPAKAAGARFKGTMMMQSAPVVGATPESPSATPAPAITAPVPAAPAAAPATSTAPKPMLKATMLGAGIAAPPKPAGDEGKAPSAPQPTSSATPPVEDTRRKLAFAATAPAQGAFVLPTQAPAGTDSAPTGGTPKKFLPGDPMAPHPGASRTHSAARISAVTVDPKKTWVYIAIACVGVIVIGAVGVGMAVYLGLASFGK